MEIDKSKNTKNQVDKNENLSKNNKNTVKNNKNSSNIVKNLLKHKKNDLLTKFKTQLYDEMFEWLSGIQEDAPIPLEVEYIYFCFDTKQNDIVFSYSADENLLPFFTLGFYAPIEAQYFDSKILKDLSKDIFEKNQKSLLERIFLILKDIAQSVSKKLWFLKDKTILVGKMFEKINV